jgi:hypothetical protein
MHAVPTAAAHGWAVTLLATSGKTIHTRTIAVIASDAESAVSVILLLPVVMVSFLLASQGASAYPHAEELERDQTEIKPDHCNYQCWRVLKYAVFTSRLVLRSTAS